MLLKVHLILSIVSLIMVTLTTKSFRSFCATIKTFHYRHKNEENYDTKMKYLLHQVSQESSKSIVGIDLGLEVEEIDEIDKEKIEDNFGELYILVNKSTKILIVLSLIPIINILGTSLMLVTFNNIYKNTISTIKTLE